MIKDTHGSSNSLSNGIPNAEQISVRCGRGRIGRRGRRGRRTRRPSSSTTTTTTVASG